MQLIKRVTTASTNLFRKKRLKVQYLVSDFGMLVFISWCNCVQCRAVVLKNKNEIKNKRTKSEIPL